jgi:hypothetical protein
MKCPNCKVIESSQHTILNCRGLREKTINKIREEILKIKGKLKEKYWFEKIDKEENGGNNDIIFVAMTGQNSQEHKRLTKKDTGLEGTPLNKITKLIQEKLMYEGMNNWDERAKEMKYYYKETEIEEILENARKNRILQREISRNNT